VLPHLSRQLPTNFSILLDTVHLVNFRMNGATILAAFEIHRV
jgi:hypothetical protein